MCKEDDFWVSLWPPGFLPDHRPSDGHPARCGFAPLARPMWKECCTDFHALQHTHPRLLAVIQRKR